MSALPPKAVIKLVLTKGAANDPKQSFVGCINSLDESGILQLGMAKIL